MLFRSIDIDLSEWEPEWADYVPSNIISTPVRPKKRGRVPTPKTTRKFDAKGDVLPLETPSVVKRTRLTYNGGKTRRKKTRRKRRKKTRRKRRKKTRRKRRKKTRRKRRKTRRKKTRKKKGGNGDNMPGIEMTEINKTYTQNQPPQNQPQPLHQQLNKKGQKTWKTLKGFFGLTPSKEVQAKHWEKHDKQVASIIFR